MTYRQKIAHCLTVCLASISLLAPASLIAQTGQAPQTQSAAQPDPHAAEKLAAQKQALGFLQYLDQSRYAESYAYTSSLLRSKASQAQFTQQVQRDRSSLGALQSRQLTSATYTTSFQGVPPGQYIVLNYTTDFANKKNAAELVTLAFENGYWRVAGWNVRDIDSGSGAGQPQNQPQGQPQDPQTNP